MERKGASYQITQKRPAQDPSEHEQVTQGSHGSNLDFSTGWRHPKTGLEMTPDEEFEEEQRWEARADQERYGDHD